MTKSLYLIFLSTFILTSFTSKKQFPKIEYKTTDGKVFNNSAFQNKVTIVLLGYLGCPAAMTATKDLTERTNQLQTKDELQIVYIFENTTSQILDFNSDKSNNWSDLRKYYKLEPIKQNIIADCETENIKYVGSDIIIGRQCRQLSRILHTLDSPTLFIVKDNKIIGKMKGYYGSTDQNERIKKLNKLINASS